MYVDKNIWLATNFASSMIKKGKPKTRAVEISSDYYGVSIDKINEQLKIRQSEGQTGKKRGKFKYFVFNGIATIFIGDNYETEKIKKIFKATSSKNAQEQFNKNHYLGGYGNTNAGKFIENEEWERNTKCFETKKEAEEYLGSL